MRSFSPGAVSRYHNPMEVGACVCIAFVVLFSLLDPVTIIYACIQRRNQGNKFAGLGLKPTTAFAVFELYEQSSVVVADKRRVE